MSLLTANDEQMLGRVVSGSKWFVTSAVRKAVQNLRHDNAVAGRRIWEKNQDLLDARGEVKTLKQSLAKALESKATAELQLEHEQKRVEEQLESIKHVEMLRKRIEDLEVKTAEYAACRQQLVRQAAQMDQLKTYVCDLEKEVSQGEQQIRDYAERLNLSGAKLSAIREIVYAEPRNEPSPEQEEWDEQEDDCADRLEATGQPEPTEA